MSDQPVSNTASGRDQASAKYQTDKPDFCGVSMEEHEAFCAGWDARDEEVKRLREALVGLFAIQQNDALGTVEKYEMVEDELERLLALKAKGGE